MDVNICKSSSRKIPFMKLGRQVAYDKHPENRPTFAVIFGFVMASDFCSHLGKIYGMPFTHLPRNDENTLQYPTL